MDNIRQVGISQQNYQTDKPTGVPQGQPQAQPETKPATTDIVALGTNGVPEAGTQKKWTFLLYGAGDNNLSQFIENNVNDMEKVGSDANTHLVSQLDLSQGDCKRYYITKDDQPGIHSPMLENMGPRVDMSNPKTLTDFIVWGAKNFPGEHLALSISDHGGGTAGAIADDRDGHGGMMKPQDIKKAIKDAEDQLGKKLDVLGFDCCLMANTECAYEFKDVANYLLASEETEGGAGWPYNKVLSDEAVKRLQEALKHRINVDPKEFSIEMVKHAGDVQGDLPTMSTTDLGKMGDVARKIDTFAQAILKTDTPMSELKLLGTKTQSFTGFKDIFDFCDRVTRDETIKDPALKAAAKEVMVSLEGKDGREGAILANEHSSSYPNAHGLQIELPSWGGASFDYKELAFANDTKWADALAKMCSKKEEIGAE
jgi:hypothetical protein